MDFKKLILKMGFTKESQEIYLCWKIDENHPYDIGFLKNFLHNCPEPIDVFHGKLINSENSENFIYKPLFYEIEFDDFHEKYVGSVTLYECLREYGHEKDLSHARKRDFFRQIVFVFIPSRPLFKPLQT